MNNIIKTVIGFILMIVVVGLAGRCEYADNVIYNMDDDVYQEIREAYPNAGDVEIAKKYQNNPEYWEAKAKE